MTHDEAIAVISTIMAAWPQAQRMSNDTARLWMIDLAPLEAGLSITALERLRRELDWPPTTHQFLDAYRAVTPRATTHALPPAKPATPAKPVIEALRMVRAALSNRAEHLNHHLNPAIHCPVCKHHDHTITDPNSPNGCTHRHDCRRCAQLAGAVTANRTDESRP